MSDDWTYAPMDPEDRAFADRAKKSVPKRSDPGSSNPQSSDLGPDAAAPADPRPARATLRLRADPGARAWGFLVDAVLLFVVGFVLVFVTFIASTPFWDVPDPTDGARQRTAASGAGSAALYALNDTVPRWVSWVILVAMAAVATVLSGALAAAGRRRSLGLAIAELRVARWPLRTTDPHQLPAGWSSADVEPGQVRVAARWLLPLAIFGALSQVVPGSLAALMAVAGWLPGLVGPRRSLYDWVAGVAVMDAVRLAGLETEVRAIEGENRDPDRLYPP